MPKIIDILKERTENQKDKDIPLFSFEYYPPKTPKGVLALYKRVWRMNKQGPLFCDLTWGAGGSTSDLTLAMTSNLQQTFGVEMNMHLTCTNIRADTVTKALVDAKNAGIRNIVSLRGDPPVGQETWKTTEGGFSCGLDLTKFIRKEHADLFGVSVAGYPEGHPTAMKKVEDLSALSVAERGRLSVIEGEHWVCYDADFEKEMVYLKQKVDAGGDFIMTQLFYDAEVFFAFERKCRSIGITVPIFPGIMPISNRGGFKRMAGFCKTRIPYEIRVCLEACKDDESFKKLGHQIILDLCKTLWKSGKVPALHFFTLNAEAVTYALLRDLGIPLVDVQEDMKEEMEKAYETISAFKVVNATAAQKEEKKLNGTEPDAKKLKTDTPQ